MFFQVSSTFLAQEAFPPVPVVSIDGDSLTLYMRLTVSGQGASSFTSDQIAVSDGIVGEVTMLDSDMRVLTGENLAMRKVILLGDGKAYAHLKVRGTDVTTVSFSDKSARNGVLSKFSLGEVMNAWHGRNDRFDPFALIVPWSGNNGSVRIELVRPLGGKFAVLDRKVLTEK